MKKILIIFISCVICLAGCNMDNPVSDNIPEAAPKPEISEERNYTIMFSLPVSFTSNKSYNPYNLYEVKMPENINYGEYNSCLPVKLPTAEFRIKEDNHFYLLSFKGWRNSKGELITNLEDYIPSFENNSYVDVLTAVWEDQVIKDTKGNYNYYITTSTGFFNLRKIISEYPNCTIHLLTDVNEPYTCLIEVLSDTFNGVFEGNYHSIFTPIKMSNMKNAGLFSIVDEKGLIKNLTLKGDIEFDTVKNAGAFAGILKGRLYNCNVENSFVSLDSNYTGKLIGIAENNSIIEGCKAEGYLETNTGIVGGLVEKSISSIFIGNENISHIKGTGNNFIGGLIGEAINSKIIACISNGGIINPSYDNIIFDDNYIGSFIGKLDKGLLVGCISKMNLTTSSPTIGNVINKDFTSPSYGVAYYFNNPIIENCYWKPLEIIYEWNRDTEMNQSIVSTSSTGRWQKYIASLNSIIEEYSNHLDLISSYKFSIATNNINIVTII